MVDVQRVGAQRSLAPQAALPRKAPSSKSPQQQPPQTRDNPFALSHPLVYAVRVEDRVRGLGGFIRDEIAPKVSRLQREHGCIEHQLQQRTAMMIGSNNQTTSSSKQKMKHQAWLYKRTSKKRELNRMETFLELATNLYRISNELNPAILYTTVLWQRSQSIAPRDFVAAEVDRDVVCCDSNSNNSSDNDCERRRSEQRRLLQAYRNACLENVRLSKAVWERLDRLDGTEQHSSATSAVSSLSTSTVASSNNGESSIGVASREDASILSSLRIFCNSFFVCSSCRGIFHRDYYQALVVRLPDHQKTLDPSPSFSPYICIHCWNTWAREQRQERNRKALGRTTNLPQRTAGSTNQSLGNSGKLEEDRNGRGCAHTKVLPAIQVPSTSGTSLCNSNKKEFVPQKKTTTITPPAKSHENAKNSKFESARYKARKKVIQDRISMARSQNCASAKNHEPVHAKVEISVTNITTPRSQKESTEGNWSELGSSLSSSLCLHPALKQSLKKKATLSIPLEPTCPLKLAEQPPRRTTSRTDRISTMKLKMNSCAVLDSDNSHCADTAAAEKQSSKSSWSRFGSSESSICSNSIAECESLHSTACTPSPQKQRVRTNPIRKSTASEVSDHAIHSIAESLCSDSFSIPASVDLHKSFGKQFLKSAMKTKTLLDSIASVSGGCSPTKVQDFPFTTKPTKVTPSCKKKNVRFRTPLVEYSRKDQTTFIEDSSILDTSAEIMEATEYFCTCDTLMSAFEKNKYRMK